MSILRLHDSVHLDEVLHIPGAVGQKILIDRPQLEISAIPFLEPLLHEQFELIGTMWCLPLLEHVVEPRHTHIADHFEEMLVGLFASRSIETSLLQVYVHPRSVENIPQMNIETPFQRNRVLSAIVEDLYP